MEGVFFSSRIKKTLGGILMSGLAMMGIWILVQSNEEPSSNDPGHSIKAKTIESNIKVIEETSPAAEESNLIEFDEVPLSEIVKVFNARNQLQIEVADAELNDSKLTAAFRFDNPEGFAELLEVVLGAQAEREGTKRIILRKGN